MFYSIEKNNYRSIQRTVLLSHLASDGVLQVSSERIRDLQYFYGVPKMAVLWTVTHPTNWKSPNRLTTFQNLTHHQKCVTTEITRTNEQQTSLFPLLHWQKKTSRRNGILHIHPPPHPTRGAPVPISSKSHQTKSTKPVTDINCGTCV